MSVHQVAQHYPIGAAWTHDGYKNTQHRDKLDRKYNGSNFAVAVCGDASPCAHIKNSDAIQSYALGPPYFVHRSDVLPIATEWAKFTPPVADLCERDLISDMWSYAMAAAHHEVPHTQIETFMYACFNMQIETLIYAFSCC